jgi:cytochrome oxidase Cu insertion factor (SCO1/SenC/PrrC family)
MTTGAPSRRWWWSPGWSWKVWLVISAMVLPTLGFTAWIGLSAPDEATADPGMEALARENAGGEILVIRGLEHTAYHALAPLPSPTQPRADGRPTLVFFSSPTCRPCAQLHFTQGAMAALRERAVFVEKSVDRDPVAARYGVRETPTFVLIDAEGRELGRFGAPADEVAFRAKVAELLTQ